MIPEKCSFWSKESTTSGVLNIQLALPPQNVSWTDPPNGFHANLWTYALPPYRACWKRRSTRQSRNGVSSQQFHCGDASLQERDATSPDPIGSGTEWWVAVLLTRQEKWGLRWQKGFLAMLQQTRVSSQNDSLNVVWMSSVNNYFLFVVARSLPQFLTIWSLKTHKRASVTFLSPHPSHFPGDAISPSQGHHLSLLLDKHKGNSKGC